MIPDGMICIDSEIGRKIGFTGDRFEGYLWKIGSEVFVSSIVSKAPGSFRSLVAAIHQIGLTVVVPTPLGRMQEIVRKNDYQHERRWCEEFGEEVDLWTLKPSSWE